MENQQESKALEKQQRQGLALNEQKIEEVGKMVWRLDMVVAFPLSETQIETWSKHILRLCPEATVERISEVVDMYLTGQWDFDKDKGIANIIWPLQNPTGAVWNP